MLRTAAALPLARSLTALALALVSAGPARGDERPFRAAASGDATAFARLVDRVGDAAVLDRLGDAGASPVERLVAVRAAPFLDDPAAAVPALVALAASRDPDLGPEAIAALLDVSRSPRLLRADVVDRAGIAASRDALRTLAGDPALRPDLVATLAAAGEMWPR